MLKSSKFHNLSEKANILQTVCFTIENVVLDIKKVVKNQFKIDAKSMQEKGMQKVCKMFPKGFQNSPK